MFDPPTATGTIGVASTMASWVSTCLESPCSGRGVAKAEYNSYEDKILGSAHRRFEVEVLNEEVTFSSITDTTLSPTGPKVSCHLHYALLVGRILYLLPELRELSIDMTVGHLGHPNFSSIQYLFRRNDEFMNSQVPEIPAFKRLARLQWDTHHLPAAVACLPALEHLSLHGGCWMPDTSDWGDVPKTKSLSLGLSAAALKMDSTSHERSSADNHLFNFISRCTSLRRLEIEISPIWPPVSAHVEPSYVLLKRLAAAAPDLESLLLGPRPFGHSCLDHILPVHHALQSFPRLKHIRLPQEMLFDSKRTLPETNHRFASIILPGSLESLEIQYPNELVFDFLECLKREYLDLSALKRVSIICHKHRGVHYAKKNGTGGMLLQWNKSDIVKQLYKVGIYPSIRYSDRDAPEAWKDVYEQTALGLERFLASLGSELSPETTLIFGNGKRFVWCRGVPN
ncbi:hypothetical protein IQ06DRAFT_304728 [Phaeosphaeriaceae sp. SRC1lsM3a]|nr:hypothetical protein IQ06DRAFT_304728 [Stagonospora sp. SRC1lsM3a]